MLKRRFDNINFNTKFMMKQNSYELLLIPGWEEWKFQENLNKFRNN